MLVQPKLHETSKKIEPVGLQCCNKLFYGYSEVLKDRISLGFTEQGFWQLLLHKWITHQN